MRYKAFVYDETTGSSGHPTRTLSDTALRCDVRVKSTWENDDEALGIYSTTTYIVTFWKKSADAHDIRPGAFLQIDGVEHRVVSTKPGGQGLKQYLICETQVGEDS